MDSAEVDSGQVQNIEKTQTNCDDRRGTVYRFYVV